MCIIVAKPVNVEFPSWKTLETCFYANPDGAGFMYNTADGKVKIKKGFMTWKAFKHALRQAKKEMTDSTACVMHFRITTHGETSKECCHPFPLEGKLDLLRQTELTTTLGVAHNGIISGRKTNTKKSDTMDYIMSVLYPLYRIAGRDFMGNKYVNALIDETIDGCRLAILDGNGKINFTGNWVTENGVSYSNNSFRGYKQYSTAYDWNSFGDYWTNTPKPSYAKSSTAITPYYSGWEDDDDDYCWEEDYVKAFDPEFADAMPSKCCLGCPELTACCEYECWLCQDKQEAEDFVYGFSRGA